VFLLVLAYPGCPGPQAVKRLRVCVCGQYTVDCLTTLGTDDIDDLSSQFL